MNKIQTHEIPGLSLETDFLSPEEETLLVQNINTGVWLTALKRRTQHYGYWYNYTTKSLTKENYLGPLPNWLLPLAEKIQIATGDLPNQAIVNEYLPGQGINPHVDSAPQFGGIITSIGLLAECTMVFQDLENTQYAEVYLPPRSRITLEKEARYHWRHGIPQQKENTRISITFRTAQPD